MVATGFILGLLGSLHCVGMCGPIAFMLPVDRTNTYKKGAQIALYHVGRLLAYATIGLVFGLLGKSLYIFGMQQKLSVVIGVVMIVAILLPYKTFSKYNISKPIFRIISKVKTSLGKQFKKKSMDTFFTIGFLNGFLPCGLVYMAVFGAIAFGSAWQGSLYMVFFGLGTIPLMTTAIYVGKFLNTTIKQRIQKAIPVFVVVIGALFILRGLGLGIPYISPASNAGLVTNTMNCH
ncbi:sulfite exporter TauE/SafE family protein [Kordia zhangzhouensis]|uniref:sulfite exporter TauE/SafE family protein n=1 Tax=Kordia zhangzhouensis TaxID=1620405 RepID=UPI0006294097|nr:sulfite exporter TauE/SafE family protein [Kordia zhangzhouensis]